jgi:predicted Zn-dependent protease
MVLALWFLVSSADRYPDGVTAEDIAIARVLFRERYSIEPDHTDTLAMLGTTLQSSGRLPAAIACLQRIPETHPRFGLSGQLELGIALIEADEAEAGETALRRYLKLAEDSPTAPAEDQITARMWLTYLLTVQLRFEDRHAIHLQTHALGLASLNDSKQLYFPHLLLYRTAKGAGRLREFLDKDPDNVRLRVAAGRYLIGEGRVRDAAQMLRALRQQHPQDLACAAALAECIYELDDVVQLEQLLSALPEWTASEPWLLTEMRGRLALMQQRWDEARERFEQLLRLEPAHPGCQMGLLMSLRHSHEEASAEIERAELKSLILSRIRVKLAQIAPANPAAILDLAAECEQIGLSDAAHTLRSHARASTHPPTL